MQNYYFSLRVAVRVFNYTQTSFKIHFLYFYSCEVSLMLISSSGDHIIVVRKEELCCFTKCYGMNVKCSPQCVYLKTWSSSGHIVWEGAIIFDKACLFNLLLLLLLLFLEIMSISFPPHFSSSKPSPCTPSSSISNYDLFFH